MDRAKFHSQKKVTGILYKSSFPFFYSPELGAPKGYQQKLNLFNGEK